MQLYKINQEIMKLVTEANPETGEIDLTAFTALSIAKEEKQKNIIYVCNHLDSDTQAIEDEIERLKTMKAKTENAKNALLRYLKDSMDMDGITELDFTIFKAKIKKNPPRLEIKDETNVPVKFWKEKIVKSVDKDAIKEALKSGEEIAGCYLFQGTRLEIK